MNAKEFVETLNEGKNVYLNNGGTSLIHITMVKHPTGTYVYMDVPNGVYVTVDRIEAAAVHEIVGWAGDEPVLTIRTEDWFA